MWIQLWYLLRSGSWALALRVEQVGGFSFDPWALALRSTSKALVLRFEWSSNVWGLAPNRVGFSAESLFLLLSLALAVESAQIEILGFSAESQMVEQSGGL